MLSQPGVTYHGMRSEAVLAEANRLSGRSWEMRPLMKKARLPRFGKALVS